MLKLNNKQLKRSPCFKIFLTFLILSFFSLLMTGMQKPEPESLVYIALKVLMKAGAAPLASNTRQDHPSRHSKSKALLKSYSAIPHPLLWEPTALIASLAAQIASLIFLGRTEYWRLLIVWSSICLNLLAKTPDRILKSELRREISRRSLGRMDPFFFGFGGFEFGYCGFVQGPST